ncbi:hypothetical protein [Allorhizobium undicola]|uniref:hypothetical protein n=1 Tax=Allorhizobium undicola TaxID=78527 RepID=UPI0012B56226|nr:hypothetical protein [Allorhizobium undicola]
MILKLLKGKAAQNVASGSSSMAIPCSHIKQKRDKNPFLPGPPIAVKQPCRRQSLTYCRPKLTNHNIALFFAGHCPISVHFPAISAGFYRLAVE